MTELQAIRNAANALQFYIKRDYEEFLIKNSHGQISKKRVTEIEKNFASKFMELKQIEININKIRPFEVAADRHLDNSNIGVTSIAYRQMFDRENLRAEFLAKYKQS